MADRLGSACLGALRSAREVIAPWKNAVMQWRERTTARVRQEVMSAELQVVMLTLLIPACYLALVSRPSAPPPPRRP